jgi:hypothetical protein
MRSHRIYSSPEFQAHVNAVLFDMEADLEHERRREYEASYVFARNQEREQSIHFCRAILGSIVFSFVFGGLLYAAWCLIAAWRRL